MKYLYKLVLFLIMIPIISCNSIDENKIAKENYKNAYNKWKKLNIKKYYMKLNFAAFSPASGIIELEVENGKIVKYIQKGVDKTDQLKNNMPELTMENLFEKAKSSYMNDPKNIFTITADYDKDYGYVKMLGKTTFKQNAPKDKTYKYEVIDFKILD